MIRSIFMTGVCGIAIAVSSCDTQPSKPIEVRIADEESPPEVTEVPTIVKRNPEVEANPKEPERAEATVEFRFADDSAGKALAELLPPASPKSLEPATSVKPHDRALPEYLVDPSYPSRLDDLPVVRLPNPPGTKVLPSSLIDQAPYDIGGLSTASPAPIYLPEGALVRIESSNELSQPAPLPLLGKPVPDRASLDDPTADFTAKSVILETIPLRSEPDPNSKINLPNPFELRETIRLRREITETPESMPISLTVPKPDKK